MSGEPTFEVEPVTRDHAAERTVARIIYAHINDCVVRAELLDVLGISE